MGRTRPHRRPRRHRAHRRSAVARVVHHMAARHGCPVAERAGQTLWQQRRAAAHLAAGLQQEHVLPPTAARRTKVGLHRQSCHLRPPTGDARHVAAAAHQPRRVQPDFAARAAGLPEEHHTAALDKGETALWHTHRGTAAQGVVHRHEQHDRHPRRPVGQPSLHRHRADGTHRHHPCARPSPALRPGAAALAQRTPLLVRQGGDRADNAVEPPLRGAGTCRPVFRPLLRDSAGSARRECRVDVGGGNLRCHKA